MHIFSPTDLKFTKLQQKRLGKNMNQEGGGKNMNFKFNIHPCFQYKNLSI